MRGRIKNRAKDVWSCQLDLPQQRTLRLALPLGNWCHRSRTLLGTFGRMEIAVPRARLDTGDG
jgi:hypothetical protein